MSECEHELDNCNCPYCFEDTIKAQATRIAELEAENVRLKELLRTIAGARTWAGEICGQCMEPRRHLNRLIDIAEAALKEREG